jgi:hypothetical protein
LLIQSSLADLTVRVSGSPQFIVGSVLQHQQAVVGTGQRLQDLIELALRGCLLARLTVLKG